jgi:glycosyltransferase involved in cell wall biosynthesis
LIENFNRHVSENFNLKYLYQQNSGSQSARNAGTKASTGEFIQYLDSDDLLYAEKITTQVTFLEINLDCDGVFGDWEKGVPENKALMEARESEDMIAQLLAEDVIHTLAFLFRRRIVNKIGEWDVNMKRNQEMDFQVRGLLEGGIYRYQHHLCGLWRLHEGTRIGNSTGSKQILCFFEKWEKLLKEKGLLTERVKQAIANVLYWTAVKEVEKPDKLRIRLLAETVRLYPNKSFFSTPKMRLMVRYLGNELALRLWFFWYKRHLK